MNFVEITSNNNWFKQHPEKVAGVEFETTSIFFPIQVKGTKEDVLRVTGISDVNKNTAKAEPKELSIPVIRYKENSITEVIKTKLKVEKYKDFENFFIYINPPKNIYFIAILKLTYNNKEVYFDYGTFSTLKLNDITQSLIDKGLENMLKGILDRKEKNLTIPNKDKQIAIELGIIEDTENEIKKEPKEKKPFDKNVFNAPVIRYKSNGNDVTKKSIPIKSSSTIKNFYTREYPGNEDMFFAVVKVSYNNKEVYYDIGSYYNYRLKDITQKMVDEQINKLLDSVLDTEKVRYVRLSEKEMAKDLGIDTSHLDKLHNEFLKQKEKEEIIKEKEKKQAAIEREEKEKEINEANLLKEQKKFLNSEKVDGESIIELCKKYNIPIHIRTIGAIRKNAVSFKKDLNNDDDFQYYYRKYKGKKAYTLTDSTFLFELIKKIREQENSDKTKRIRLATAKAKAIKIKLSLNENL